MTELDGLFQAQFPCGPLSLLQVVGIGVDAGYLRSPARQLEAVIAGVASDIQRSPPVQSARQMRGERVPLVTGEVAQEMRRCRFSAIRQVKVVEPGAQFLNLGLEPSLRGVDLLLGRAGH